LQNDKYQKIGLFRLYAAQLSREWRGRVTTAIPLPVVFLTQALSAAFVHERLPFFVCRSELAIAGMI
jgi:hypothetical protein